jgi:hypothetical protein
VRIDVLAAVLLKRPVCRGEFRPRQLPRAVDLKGQFYVSCCGKMLKKSYNLNFIIDAKFNT